MLILLRRISRGVARLSEIDTASLVVAIILGVVGLVYAHLSLRNDQQALDHAKQPFEGQSAFFISSREGKFVLDKSRTVSAGHVEVFFCQQGIGMAQVIAVSFLPRDEVIPLPDPALVGSTISTNLPITLMAHVWFENGGIETSYHVFDPTSFARIKSQTVPNQHLVCVDTYS